MTEIAVSVKRWPIRGPIGELHGRDRRAGRRAWHGIIGRRCHHCIVEPRHRGVEWTEARLGEWRRIFQNLPSSVACDALKHLVGVGGSTLAELFSVYMKTSASVLPPTHMYMHMLNALGVELHIP